MKNTQKNFSKIKINATEDEALYIVYQIAIVIALVVFVVFAWKIALALFIGIFIFDSIFKSINVWDFFKKEIKKK